MAMTPWQGQKAEALVFADVGRRVNAAGRWFRDQLRNAVSIENAVLDETGKMVKDTRGSVPSAPGEYPRKVSGWFRMNINAEFDQTILTSRVGTNVLYGKWLETGTRKMAPRPWLSNGLRDFLTGIRGILESGGGQGAVTTGMSPDDKFGGTPEGKRLALLGRIHKTEQAMKDLGAKPRTFHRRMGP